MKTQLEKTRQRDLQNFARGVKRREKRDAEALDDLAGRINESYAKCVSALKVSTQHAIEVGKLLIEAKAKVPHGQWLPWIKENCDFSESLARKYMKVAEELPKLAGANQERVTDLSFRQALELLQEPRIETVYVKTTNVVPDVQTIPFKVTHTTTTTPPVTYANRQTGPTAPAMQAAKAAEPAARLPGPEPDAVIPEERMIRRKGVALAHEAINALQRIPQNDELRTRAFEIVGDWVELNGPPRPVVVPSPKQFKKLVRAATEEQRLEMMIEIFQASGTANKGRFLSTLRQMGWIEKATSEAPHP